MRAAAAALLLAAGGACSAAPETRDAANAERARAVPVAASRSLLASADAVPPARRTLVLQVAGMT